jgi:hypothetical protein
MYLAEKAFNLYQKSLDSGELDLASLYLLNAITHDPILKFAQAYIDLINKYPKEKQADMVDRASNILSAAALQGDPDNIKQIGDIQAKLLELIRPTEQEQEIQQDSLNSVDQFYAEFKWDYLKENGSINDIEIIHAKSNALRKLIDEEPLSINVQKRLETEFQETLSFLEYLAKKDSIEIQTKECSELLDENTNFHNEMIEAKLQQIRSFINQLWLINIEGIIPKGKYIKLITEMSEEASKQEKKFLDKISVQPYNKLNNAIQSYFDSIKKSLLDNFSNSNNHSISSAWIVDKLGNVTTKDFSKISFDDLKEIIEALHFEKGIEKNHFFSTLLKEGKKIQLDLSTEISSIRSRDYYNKILELANQLNEILHVLEKKRYAVYQQYCAHLCKKALQSYHDTTWVSEKDASEILSKHKIAEIDESLLSPECAEIYHAARNMLKEKLDKKDSRIDFQVTCVTSDKITLENF